MTTIGLILYIICILAIVWGCILLAIVSWDIWMDNKWESNSHPSPELLEAIATVEYRMREGE
jgi:hypothetical protein